MDDDTTETDVRRTGETNITSDRETIRTWVEDTDATPAYRTTESGERELYVRHADDTTEDYEETTWDEFHERMNEDEHVLVRHPGASDREPRFELLERSEAIERASLEDEEVERALMEGETVETEITETKVIEKTIQETETYESEVVDSEIVRDEIVDTQLVRREISDIHLGERDTGVAIVSDYESTGWEEEVEEFEIADRGIITLDVDETREVTREMIERKTVHTRMVDHDIEETETVESDTLESQVDLEGVQRTILESDLLVGEIVTEDVIESGHVESEITDEGVIETRLYERRIVEDEVVDRKRLTFELTDEELVESETVESVLIETMLIGSDEGIDGPKGERLEIEGVAIERDEAAVGGVTTGAEAATTDTDVETTGAETTATGTETETAGTEPMADTETVTLDDADVGKDVYDDNDEKVGVVTEVDEAENVMYVDPHPGLAQRVKTRLGWEGHDDDAYSVTPDRIAAIDDDSVRLREF